ncbi:EamA family transporter [Calidifontibacter terrae]
MAVLLALLSSAVWGSSDFAGGLFARRIAAVKVVAIGQIGGLIATTIVFWWIAARSGFPSGTAWFGWAAASGATGAIGLLCLYAALAVGRMGVVSPIASLGAGVPVVLGFVSGDRLSALVLFGLFVVLLGVVLASGPELRGGAGARPVALAAVAACCFGVSLFTLDQAASHGVGEALFGMRLVSVATLLIAWRMWPGGPGGGVVRRIDVPLLMIVGCGDLAANALFGFAARQGEAGLVGVLGSLYPVATILWARVLLGERLRPVQLIGVAAILVGVAVVVS